jgi:hypothetical protein
MALLMIARANRAISVPFAVLFRSKRSSNMPSAALKLGAVRPSSRKLLGLRLRKEKKQAQDTMRRWRLTHQICSFGPPLQR